MNWKTSGMIVLKMKLYAISDLHLNYEENRASLESLLDHRDDWLIVAGDVGETKGHLEFLFRSVVGKFAKVIWLPGNHELWTIRKGEEGLRGEAKYLDLVALCRSYGVSTPEDPFPVWPEPKRIIAPLFVLYDYTFRPDSVAQGSEISWAMESGLLCADEEFLHPDPFSSISEWCNDRVVRSERRIEEALRENPDAKLILANHFPVLYEHAVLPRIPRFTIWCGTKQTEPWIERYPVSSVVYGHLHIPATKYKNGVRFDEVSFGYPSQRRSARSIEESLREIVSTEPPR